MTSIAVSPNGNGLTALTTAWSCSVRPRPTTSALGDDPHPVVAETARALLVRSGA